SDQFRPQSDVADGSEQIGGLHPAGFRRPGPGGEAGIEDIDVDREVDELGAVERLLDGLPDDGLDAPVEQLAHQVPAHPLGPHPLEGLELGPVAAQPDLDEVSSRNGAGLDQATHRRGVRGQVAPGALAGWELATRTARGPKRAPGRYVVPSSQGAPTIAASGATPSSSSGSVSARAFMKVAGPRYCGPFTCASRLGVSGICPSGVASGL